MTVSEKEIFYMIFCGKCGYTSGRVYKGFPKYIRCPDCKRNVYDLDYVTWDEDTQLSENDIQDLNEVLV